MATSQSYEGGSRRPAQRSVVVEYIDLDTALKSILEQGYEIAANRGLVGLKKKVYRSDEVGFRSIDNNFGHMVMQEWMSQEYEDWFNVLEKAFTRFGLQISKFKIKADTFDSDKESNRSAQRFIRRINELEKIVNDKNYLNTFISTSTKPRVSLVKNMLSQGSNKHPLEPEYESVIRLLWKGREIINSKKEIIKKPSPTTRPMVYSKLNINHEALVRISKGIKAINTKKNIDIHLVYPKNEGVYLVVTQDMN